MTETPKSRRLPGSPLTRLAVLLPLFFAVAPLGVQAARGCLPVEVVVAARALDAGADLTEGDVTTKRYARRSVPAGAVRERADAVGRRLRAGVAGGAVVVAASLLPAPSTWAGGKDVVPLRVDDGVVAAEEFVAGDVVDVLFAPAGGQPGVPPLPAARIDGVVVVDAGDGDPVVYLLALTGSQADRLLDYQARGEILLIRS